MQPGDEELMQRIKEGNMHAFDILVRRWEDKLFNFIYKIIGEYESAEDIRQEVFLRVYQAAKRYRPEAQFSTWLYRIAINCSLNELKKRKRHRTVSLAMFCQDKEAQNLENILTDPNPQPDEIIQRDEIARYIQDALDKLPDKQRIVIILRHYEGLKFHQIASILDCPVSTVKSRMKYGLERLQVILKDSKLLEG